MVFLINGPSSRPTIAESQDNIRMVQLGKSQSGSTVYALRLDNKAVLLDLTPGKDDWVQLGRGFDHSLLQRSETTVIKVLVEVPCMAVPLLKAMDTRIWHQCREFYPAIKYMPMVQKENMVLVSMVMEGSTLLTELHFSLLDGTCVTGTGLEFLKAQLGDKSFEDFECKMLVELQCIEKTLIDGGKPDPRRTGVTIKVHSAFFAEVMQQKVISYSPERLIQFSSFAKRRRLNSMHSFQ